MAMAWSFTIFVLIFYWQLRLHSGRFLFYTDKTSYVTRASTWWLANFAPLDVVVDSPAY